MRKRAVSTEARRHHVSERGRVARSRGVTARKRDEDDESNDRVMTTRERNRIKPHTHDSNAWKATDNSSLLIVLVFALLHSTPIYILQLHILVGLSL